MFRRISLGTTTILRSSIRQLERILLGGQKITKSDGKLVLVELPNWYKVEPYTSPKLKYFQCVVTTILRQIFRPTQKQISDTTSKFPPVLTPVIGMDIRPPEAVRGMKTLDKDLFKTSVKIPGIKVPAKNLPVVIKNIKKETVAIRRVKPIVKLDSDDELASSHKLILLDPGKHPDSSSFTTTQLELFKDNDVDMSHLAFYDIDLGYENWPADEILRAILPVDQESVSGFSLIGHIAHLNLRSYALEYKNIIGEVILDKTSTVRTVVNKLDTIDNTFRNFNLEVLAGEANFITTVKENGSVFEMDFSKVYWNSRLSTEHQRILDQLQNNDVVYDVFAGIGPFAIPAAKKGCVVTANDLNPDSYKWLQHNVKKNKIKTDISTHNLDGRDFITNVVKPDLVKRLNSEDINQNKIHFVMNLPALAIEFLDTFLGLLEDERVDHFTDLMVHCYCFSKEDDHVKDVRERVEQSLGLKLADDLVIRHVRHVAPKKEMLCAEFFLSEDLLMRKCEEPPRKKVKTDDDNDIISVAV